MVTEQILLPSGWKGVITTVRTSLLRDKLKKIKSVFKKSLMDTSEVQGWRMNLAS